MDFKLSLIVVIVTKGNRDVNIPVCYRRFMYLHDIHNEMKNECGDAQERKEVIDPLRAPLPEGNNDWEIGFMKTMRKAKKYGWTLSEKQINTLERIREEEEYREREELRREGLCHHHNHLGDCDQCHDERIEADFGHMSEAELERWNAFARDVLDDRDVMSGAYGPVPIFCGPCPKSYDSSGYSRGSWGR